MTKYLLFASLIALTGLTGMTACTSLETDKLQYRSAESHKVPTLDLPPDVAQLTRGNAYAFRGGGVSVKDYQVGVAAAPAASTALTRIGDVRMEGAGTQHWLVADRPVEALWEPLLDFWQENGFLIDEARRESGVMETDWAETRAKLPQDIVRSTVGRVVESAYATGSLDRFRTRLERTPQGTEIFISHRGMEEVNIGGRKDKASWQAGPTDPELEAAFLLRLMARLGGAAAPASPALSVATARVPQAGVANVPPVLRIATKFERAWSQVGAALDRTGFTVEDRDRAAGLYTVRYVTPRDNKGEPGLFAGLFSLGRSSPPKVPLRFRIMVQGEGEATVVSVLDAAGAADATDDARRIVKVLSDDLN